MPDATESASPARGAICLRWLPVQPDDPAAVYWRSLSDDAERAQADRFRFAADRLCYMAAHTLTRLMLTAAGGLPPQTWRFLTGHAGKPFAGPRLGRPALRFNQSHARYGSLRGGADR